MRWWTFRCLWNADVLRESLTLGLHPLHEHVVTEVDLPIQVSPDRLFPYPLRNILSLAPYRLSAFDRELRQQPIRGQPVRRASYTQHIEVTAPALVAWQFHHACAYGIENDIPGQFEKIGVSIDQDRLVSSLKKMSATVVPMIRCLGIDTVQLPHSLREIPVGRLNHKVVMISHQTIGVTDPIEVPDHSFQDFQKPHPVGVILINRFPSITSGSDMIERTLELNSYGSGHTTKYSPKNGPFLDLTPVLP